MKAFLSHSSKDKGFVEAVANFLRPGTFELDSLTFDLGLINSDAIIKSLQRSDLFCLFLSSNSVQSPYVDFETLLGIEFFARGGIGKFLAICMDQASFEQASANIRFFNVVRKGVEVESTARLIQGNLVSATKIQALRSHPFIGREVELVELEKQVTDHKRPPTKAVFISGNFGSGRKTVGKNFYEDQYPMVGQVFPTINIEQFSGLEELFRKLLIELRPSIVAKDLKTRAQAFTIASTDEKRRLIAQLLNSLLQVNEAAFLIDRGGILTDSGSLDAEINEVISRLEFRPHPPAIIIAPRMIPIKLRRQENDLSYLAVKSLKRDSSERLISRLLRDRGIQVTTPELGELVNLSDGHPFNIYRMMDEVSERGVHPFLASPSDFIDWKHRQSSEYLDKIGLSETDVLILALLKLIPELDFTAIVDAMQINPEDASDALLRLVNLHIVESSAERFIVSPALRIAVEKDKRIILPSDLRSSAIKSLAKSLLVRLEEGTAPVALIDAAVLSALEAGGTIARFATAFLLPSHYVWLAKRNYDEENYHESIRLAREALKGYQRLSPGGLVAACRYLCLAGARVGEASTFDEGIQALEGPAKDDWARSNIAFLKGFNYRLKGNLPQAEKLFKDAYNLSPGNSSAAREIAAICLARGNLDVACCRFRGQALKLTQPFVRTQQG